MTIRTMLATFLMTSFTALVYFNLKTAEHIKGNGKRTTWKESENLNGRTVALIKVNSFVIECRDREFFTGLKNVQLRVAGMQVNRQRK